MKVKIHEDDPLEYLYQNDVILAYVDEALCENVLIFLSLIFYVKSGSPRNAIFTILGALNFADLVNCSLQIVTNFIKIKI